MLFTRTVPLKAYPCILLLTTAQVLFESQAVRFQTSWCHT